MATNFEHYKDEILKIIEAGVRIAVKDNIPYKCEEIPCGKCDLSTEECECELIKWLYKEYKPITLKLTAKERALCEVIRANAYLMREHSGKLFLTCDKIYFLEIDRDLFSFIKKGQLYSFKDLLKLEVE